MDNKILTAFVVFLAYGSAVLVIQLISLLFGWLSPWTVGGRLLVLLTVIVLASTEFTFGLWQSYPGSAGLGSLKVFWPAFASGLTVAISLQLFLSYLTKVRTAESAVAIGLAPNQFLNYWLILIVLNIVVAICFWRFWPAPMARLSPW